jgi:hypothetical protein
MIPVIYPKHVPLILVAICFVYTTHSQTPVRIAGSYISIDSTTSSYQKEGKWYKDIDTTLLTLNTDMTFIYKWSPTFGPSSMSHIVTTGNWKLENGDVVLNSRYQKDEHRFFESHRPEYGDSIVKVYVQTYDSLIGFFQFQFIGVVKDGKRSSQMIFKDKDYSYNACSATFPLKSIEKIVFYGNFGKMPAVIPKDSNSNHFLLQYNLSAHWDYQYFKDFRIRIDGNKAVLGDGDNQKELIQF